MLQESDRLTIPQSIIVPNDSSVFMHLLLEGHQDSFKFLILMIKAAIIKYVCIQIFL